MKRLVIWLPLALFLAFVAVVAFRLIVPDDPTIRSRLVGKPVPAFALPAAVPGKAGLTSTDLAQGKPRIVNIFASWCIPCMVEAPQMMQLAKMGVPIDAIAIRDRPEDIRLFLDQRGDPYQRIGSDVDGRVMLAFGSTAVPESFVVDGKGIIRYQHIGDIRPEHIPELMRQYEAAR